MQKKMTPVLLAKFEMTCFVHIFRLQDLAINKESVDKECQGLQQTIVELDATCQVKSICCSITQKLKMYFAMKHMSEAMH